MDSNIIDDSRRAPGWHAHGDDPSSMRWWSGTEWVGHPTPISPSMAMVVEPRAAPDAVRAVGRRLRGFEWLALTVITLSSALQWLASTAVSIYPGLSLSLMVIAQLAVIVIFAVLVVVLAFVDRHALLRSGQPSAASGFWVLLSPIAYLAARAVHGKRHAGRGWFPFWFYLVSSVVITWIITAELAILVLPQLQAHLQSAFR
jgi:hypothetical protein